MNDLLKEANEFRDSSIKNIMRCHKKYGRFSIIITHNEKEDIATIIIHKNDVPFYRDDFECNKQIYKIIADSICLHIIGTNEYSILSSMVNEKESFFHINAKNFDFVRTYSQDELTQMIDFSIKVSEIITLDRNIHI